MSLDAKGVWSINLRPGERYSREDLHAHFGGQRQSGIVTPREYPVVFLFSSPRGHDYGYQDGWSGDLYIYSGEGTKGDMTFTRGNRALRDHEAIGKKLYLFFRDYKEITYFLLGEFRYAGHFWRWAPDETGQLRRALAFLLEPLEGALREGSRVSLDPETEIILEHGRLETTPHVQKLVVGRYARNPSVARTTLRRAGGVCELCGQPAPFLDINGEPFLEVHHIVPLAEGGPDDTSNTAALCPNCHRAVHYAHEAPSLRKTLLRLRREIL